MRPAAILLMLTLLQLSFPPPAASRSSPAIHARAAALYDLAAQAFLYQKNIDSKLPIASITKLMTAVVAVEQYPARTRIRISKNALRAEGYHHGLRVGDTLTLEEAFQFLLIASDNAVAYALAEQGGSYENFIRLMNRKAKVLGMSRTAFIDPVGLGRENVSSVRDIIVLVSYIRGRALHILEISARPRAILKIAQGKTVHLLSTDKLLWRPLHPDRIRILGSKTGWTYAAGGCLVLVFERKKDAHAYIAIVLGTFPGNARFGEIKKLIRFALQP